MNGAIPLHPERGLDPHLTVCPVCRKEDGLTIGQLWKAEMEAGFYTYTSDRPKTRREIGDQLKSDFIEVKDGEKVEMVCDECLAKAANARLDWNCLVAVRDGGILFKCEECNAHGAFRPDSEGAKLYCAEVRKHANMPHGLVGVSISSCEEHRG